MVKVHGEDGLGEDLVSRADEPFQHDLIGVGACSLADLNDEGSFAVDVALEQAHELLEVVDIICADGVLAVCGFE